MCSLEKRTGHHNKTKKKQKTINKIKIQVDLYTYTLIHIHDHYPRGFSGPVQLNGIGRMHVKAPLAAANGHEWSRSEATKSYVFFYSVIFKTWVLVRPELSSRPPARQPDAQRTELSVRGLKPLVSRGLTLWNNLTEWSREPKTI